MLDVDYTLKVIEGTDHISTYSPLIKRINGNAAILRAPNSSGKTYFLNLIAMALYGDELTEKEARISPILQESIRDIKKRRNEKLTFDLRLESQDGKTVLHASKPNPETDQIELWESCDGNTEVPLPKATFTDNYYLVYDFPKNPLERIPEMVKSIKEEQERYQRKIKDLLRTISNMERDISNSRDDDKIEETKSTIKSLEENVARSKSDCEQLRKQELILGEYYNLRRFDSLYQHYSDLERQISHYSKTQKKVKKSTKNYNDTRMNAQIKLSQFQSQINSMNVEIQQTELRENETLKTLGDYFCQCDYLAYIDDTSSFDYNLQNQKLEMMKTEITKMGLSDEIKEASKKSDFYKQVIDLFKQAISSNLEVSIPGIDKSLDQLIDVLENEYRVLQDKSKVYKRYNDLKTSIIDLLRELSEVKKILETLMVLDSMSKSSKEEFQRNTEDSQSIAYLEKERDEIINKLDDIERNLQNCGYDLSTIQDNKHAVQGWLQRIKSDHPEYTVQFELSEADLKVKLENLGQDISGVQNRILEGNRKIGIYNDRLEQLERAETHKYYDRRNDIKRLRQIVDTLSRKLGKYERFLAQIEKEESLDETGEHYNEKLSEFLGRLIPTFPYQKEYVKPVKIDLLKKSLITEDNRQINMKNISTGQSMSLYVQTILNRPDGDKRKLIVLFDEAGTMDENSLSPLKDTMAALARDGKILFALFVSANNSEPQLDIIS